MRRYQSFTRSALVVITVMAISACASVKETNYQTSADCGTKLSQPQTIKLDLVAQLIDEGSYYSALAHLENDNSGSPRALWLMAEAQRKTGMLSEAYDVYRELSLTCMTAYGHAGMAKILATRGDLEISHQHMLKARRLAPTNADIRNDYGFILLAMQDFKAAQREFMTSLQLQPGHPVALRNMIMSLILDGDSRTAMRMAENNDIQETEFKSLIEKANHFAEPAVAKRAVIN
ncbi:hypothetical protein [Spongiibacter tropicus]|uniref:hypothetical protein n=1 Tax=Spongiibacter tropicus TaxID=454602 RepID=UPI0024E1EA46|nr:hypothetical protein [Spongiibacter tropicus]